MDGKGKQEGFRQTFRELLRNCREERGTDSQLKLMEKATCPAKAVGIMQNLLQNRKLVISWNRVKSGSCDQRKLHKSPLVSILPFVSILF